jgi:LysM repeat protein
MHRVQQGETLTSIAARYDLAIGQLMNMNGILDADELTAGQLLIVSTKITATPTPPVAETPPAAETPTAAPTSTDMTVPDAHTVSAGETLTGIARRYGLTVGQLMALNGIANPDELVEGQVLRISATLTPTPTDAPTVPAAATPAATELPPTPEPSPTATPTPTVTALPATHTVAAGETLSGIARRYGLTTAALMSLNDLVDPNAIRSGEVLQLTVPEPAELTVVDAVETPAEAGTTEATTAADTSVAALPATTPLPTPAITRSGNPIASLNRTYTVRPGDSLGMIALRLGLDLDALAALNGFADTAPPLSAGRTLLLPAVGEDLRTVSNAEAYVVKPGESLGQIAAAFGLTVGDILAANRLADPNAIYPGERLLIPVRASSGGAGFVQIGLPRSGYFYYTVQSGDTLSALADQFNTTMQAIREYNNLPDNDSVYAGREIRIPYGVPALTLRKPPVPLSGTRFVVSISRQQCWVYQGERVLHSWDCSTGAGERRTKPGNYDVQSKILNAKSNIFRLDMPYWLGIYDVGPYENGIHGLPVTWEYGRKIWSGLIGQPATFGCAMLDDLEAATLFRMAFLGMPVHVVN